MQGPAKARIQPQDTFRKRLPHEVVPTNIFGAYTSPAPPESFDIRAATPASLLKNGMFLARPSKDSHPGVLKTWERVFSRQWRAQDRIMPHLAPQYGKTHRLRRARKRKDASFQSSNWAGGTLQGNWVTCFGTWLVPTVSEPAEAQGLEGGWNSSSWLGLDGAYGSNDVLQAGVEQAVDGNGNASYVAWFEWFAPGQVGGTIDDFSNNKLILGDTSPLSPSLASFNGNLYLAWKGDGNDNLNVAAVDIDSNSGAPTGFSNKVTLGDTSPLSPSLAPLNGYLFLSWKGDGNDNLNLMFSSDGGQTFGGKLISGETSPESTALALHNGNLFIAWKGDGNDNLNVSRVDLTGFITPPYIFQTNITNFTVNPGDTVFCSVQYINNQTAGQIYFANDTTGEHFTVTLAPPPGATFDGNSLEWIMEAPDGGEPISSLPKFTPVQFTGAFGCTANLGVGDPQNGDTWNIVNGSVNPPQTLTSVALGGGAVTIDFTG
jgi:Peptidase A4 family